MIKKLQNLSSRPLLPESNVELILQQLLIICPNINGYRQTLQNKVQGTFGHNL